MTQLSGVAFRGVGKGLPAGLWVPDACVGMCSKGVTWVHPPICLAQSSSWTHIASASPLPFLFSVAWALLATQ